MVSFQLRQGCCKWGADKRDLAGELLDVPGIGEGGMMVADEDLHADWR